MLQMEPRSGSGHLAHQDYRTASMARSRLPWRLRSRYPQSSCSLGQDKARRSKADASILNVPRDPFDVPRLLDGRFSFVPPPSGTASLDGNHGLTAPGARLRSALSAPPAEIPPCGCVREIAHRESRPVPPAMHSGSPLRSWERFRSLFSAPRESGAKKEKQNVFNQSSHSSGVLGSRR
jgi:hypothetical protein